MSRYGKLLTADELATDLLELAEQGLIVAVRSGSGDLLWYPADMLPSGSPVVSLDEARQQIERCGPALSAGWN